MEIFEKAAKKKLRFETSRGLLSAEDLYDLNLTSLDNIAKAVNKKLKDESEESFIKPVVPEQSDNKLRLDILKHVIDYKLKLADAAKARQEKQAKLLQIKDLMLKKQTEEMSAKSMEDLQNMFAELGGEEVLEE